MDKSLNDYIINYDFIDKVSLETMETYEVLPIEEYDIFLFVASVKKYNDPYEVFQLFHKPVKFLYIDKQTFEFELHYLSIKKRLFSLAIQSISSFDEKAIDQSNITLFCEELFQFAISLDASDIHIETLQDALIIRFRIDGVMIQFFRLPWELYPILSSIIKLFASLDITLKRLPQDGRFSKTIGNNEYDFRVSTLPTISGESIVLRILDNQKAYLSLQDLGLDDRTYERLDKNIHLANGMILITGATGSGKTTTIYSILNKLNNKKKKIISIEDPIEYNLDGIMQVNIDEDIGLDYHTVLRNILRQDPDILMIGEIRDKVSLKIAIQASLTGHLVLATLHTNGAIQSINRLIDLEAESFMIASVLRYILSQKLIRVLCDECKTISYHDGIKSYKAVGCKKCNMSGYKGRTIVTESLEIDEAIASLIANQKDTNEISHLLNHRNLNELLYEKVLDGTTSFEEYLSHEI
jgi:general secretion pathway protein E